ncbi:MAG TPA: ABC transporter substrate-binding protein [Chloroflexota bacterium]|nr:ABC transporter substrate-binding protein [Chloroflexota bacterium]
MTLLAVLALAGCGSGTAAPAASSAPTRVVPSSAAPGTVAAKPSASAPASASAGSASTARHVKIAYATQTGTTLPIFVARDAGYFKNHGIDADITYSRDGAVGIAALVGGDVQFLVVGDPNLTNAVLQGADVEYLAWPAHTVQLVLIGQPGIKTVADLKGKTIGVTAAGSTTDLFAQALLRRNGLDPKKDVNIVAIGGSSEGFAAFTSKRVDAALMTNPFDGQAVAQGGQVVFDFKKSDFAYPQSGVAVKKTLPKSEPALVQDVITAYAEAVARFKSDKPLGVQTLMRELKVSDPKLADESYDLANAAMDNDVTPRAQDEQAILDLLAVSNPKAKDAKPQDFYDDTFAKKAIAALRSS